MAISRLRSCSQIVVSWQGSWTSLKHRRRPTCRCCRP